ncbi:MAG: recombinase family protein, partial [Bacteroidetes bacterium]|nr:recombinase family protein [Bacteroidota bacterium]
MKAVILSRVSSKEQEEGKSIKAQIENAKNYCERKNLEVLKVYEIVESSTRGSREKFNQILNYIEKYQEKIVLVADAVDRVQRSFKETVILDELRKKGKIELHFIREGIILDENLKTQDKMMWNFSVMLAESYVSQISDNTKRSILYKLNHGECIGKAPLGYKNIRNTENKADVVIDEEKAHFMKMAFELYATGNYSVRKLAKILQEKGLRTVRGKILLQSRLHEILQNKFYYGYMKH